MVANSLSFLLKSEPSDPSTVTLRLGRSPAVNSNPHVEQVDQSISAEQAGCPLSHNVDKNVRTLEDARERFRNLDEFPNDISECNFPETSTFEKDFFKVIVKRGLGRTITNDFLSLFNKYEIGNFPKDARSFLGSIRVVRTFEMSPGKYFHFGLSEALNNALKYYDFPQDPITTLRCFNYKLPTSNVFEKCTF